MKNSFMLHYNYLSFNIVLVSTNNSNSTILHLLHRLSLIQ